MDRRGEHLDPVTSRLATGLGWFSFGLGVAQVVAPGAVCRLIGVNDNWQDDPNQAALITDSGLAPSNTLESAMLTGLAPGPYTAIIRGKNGGTGVGLIEVFKVQ